MANQEIKGISTLHKIVGKVAGQRVDSRIIEEQIQAAVAQGHRNLQIEAYGQHGIGGRLWRAGDEAVHIEIIGQPGQRVGSMGLCQYYDRGSRAGLR